MIGGLNRRTASARYRDVVGFTIDRRHERDGTPSNALVVSGVAATVPV